MGARVLNISIKSIKEMRSMCFGIEEWYIEERLLSTDFE